MDMNAMMASQLRSLQSVMQMSILSNALNIERTAATEMLENLPDQSVAVHPHKGALVDIKA